jgi:CRP-like cAMP-binding protein
MNDQAFWYLENFDLSELMCQNKLAEKTSKQEDHGVKEFSKGETIYLPEDKADKIYFITSGRIKIGVYNNDKEIIKSILEKGEVFGELAVIGQENRAEFALAMEKTHLCIVTLDELKMLLLKHNTFQKFMMTLIGKRIVSVEKRLESLVFKDSRTRIVEYLLELVNTKGQRVGYELLVRKFNTHQEIANLTATSRQTVTTLLNDLRNKNILTFDRKRLLIRDIDMLKKEVMVEA